MSEPFIDQGTRWKLGIAFFVGIFVVAMAASFVTAARRVSPVVDADYYSHGLHYGADLDRTRNAGAGWTIAASVARGLLEVRVTDGDGAPVAGGRLSFEPQPGERLPDTLALAEVSPGVFQASRPAPPGAELKGTLRFSRGEAAASRRLVLLN